MCCFFRSYEQRPIVHVLSPSDSVIFCISLIFQKKQCPQPALCAGAGSRCIFNADRSDATQQNKNEDDDQNQSEATRRTITVIVLTPAWQSTDEEKNDEDNENGADHV